MKTNDILIAGFGGQGIMLMGKLLAYGAIYEGLQVTFYPSYGPEMRGGAANCTVVISSERIGSPVRSRFTHLMAMNQESADKFAERVEPGGVIVYNQSIVTTPPPRSDVTLLPVQADRIASELNNPRSANMVAVGALAQAVRQVSLPALMKGLARVLPSYRHDAIPVIEAAIHRGVQAAQSAGQSEEAPQ